MGVVAGEEEVPCSIPCHPATKHRRRGQPGRQRSTGGCGRLSTDTAAGAEGWMEGAAGREGVVLLHR